MRNFLFTILLLPFFSFSQYGVLDETFGDGGIAIHANPVDNGYVLTMKIDIDGNIYVLGSYSEFDGDVNYSIEKMFLTKLRSDGSIDLSFGNEGTVFYSIPFGWTWANDFEIIDNQYLLVMGYYEDIDMMLLERTKFFLLKVNLDSSIDENSLFLENEMKYRNYLKLCCNESECLISGEDWSSWDTDIYVQKRSVSGEMITSFGEDGTAMFGYTGISDSETFFTTNSQFEPVLLYETPDINRYDLFILTGDGGFQHSRVFYGGFNFNSVTLTQDKVYLTGSYDSDFLIQTYNSDLSNDTLFGDNGFVMKDIGYDTESGSHLIVGENGRITQVGYVAENGNSLFALTGYYANGSTDHTFGNQGITLTDVTESETDYPKKAILSASDKILVLNGQGLSLARYTIYDGLAVEDLEKNSTIQIAPNPTSNSFIINGLKGNDNTIQIFDLSGKSIREFKAVRDNQKIELGAIPKGIYLIKINDSETKKLIVR